MTSKKIYAGLDLSPNHAGFVTIDGNGELVRFAAVTNETTIAKEYPDQVVLLPAAKMRGRLEAKNWKVYRLTFMAVWLRTMLRGVSALAIEDYKYGARSNNAYDIGEVGGIAREFLIASDIPFLLVGPKQLKSYANISAKEKPIDVCCKRYGQNWETVSCGLSSSETPGDLADAHVLAHIVREATMLENGELGKPTRPVMNKIIERGFMTKDTVLCKK